MSGDFGRRSYLGAAAVALSTLAGCGSRDDADSSPSDTETQTGNESVTSTEAVGVETLQATDIGYESAALRSRIQTGKRFDVPVLFEWREDDRSEWNDTDRKITESGEFEQTVDGLASETTHQFRAVVVGDERISGTVREFTTAANVVEFDGGGTSAFAEAIEAAADRPGATLRIGQGTYHLDPTEPYDVDDPPGAHFEPTGLENVTIEGNGATLRLSEPRMGGIHFFDGSNLTVRNLTVDYDPLPFSQGTITDLSDPERKLTVSLDEGYDGLDAPRFGQGEVFASIHDPDGSFIDGVRADGLPIKRFRSMERIGDGVWRLTLNDNSTIRGLKRGRRIAITARDPPGSAQAVKLTAVDSPTLEGVTVNASPSFALLLVQCPDAVVSDVRVAPPRGSDRLVGSDADGIHAINCRGGPTITDCYVDRLLDDGIIVSAQMTPVKSVDGGSVTVRNTGSFAPLSGETLQVMAPDGTRKGELPEVESTDTFFDAPRGVSPVERIQFTGAVSDRLAPGDYLSNRATANRNFVVEDNVVRDNRANPIRLSGGPGRVENNEIDGSQNQSIVLLCDTSGRYAAERWTNDVVIRNNDVRGSGMSYLGGHQPASIAMVHTPGGGIETGGHPHRAIDVVDNEFRNLGFRFATVADVDGVTFRGNSVDGVNELDYPYGREAFLLDNVGAASVVENSVSGSASHLDHFGRRHDVADLTSEDNTFELDGEEQPTTFE